MTTPNGSSRPRADAKPTDAAGAQPGWSWSMNPATYPWRFDASRARRMAERYLLPVALFASITVHLLIALQSTLFGVGGAMGGGPGDLAGSTPQGGMVAETTLTELTPQELDAGDPADLETLPSIDAPAVDLSSLAGGAGLKIDLPSATPGSISGLDGAGLGGGSGAGDGFGEGLGDLDGGGGGGGGGGARFFGVEARGSRFVYVVDVSGSMNGERLQSLKSELTNSLDGLLTASSFLVVLFNSDAVPLGGRAKWIDASEPAKRRIYEMLGKVVAGGGTEPADAFEIAFSLKPRPDAIYFMTDGLFDTAVADQVAKLNRQDRRAVPIHCIAFGTRDAEPIMREIAQKSGGSFTYIAGP